MDYLALAGRFTLAAVFLVAGVAKLGDRPSFARAVQGYGLLPGWAARRVTRWLPVVEVVAAVLLACGVGTVAVATILGALLVAFAAGMVVNLAADRELDCGCFGSAGGDPVTWGSVARNLGLTAVAALVAAHPVPGVPAPAVAGVGLGTLCALAALRLALAYRALAHRAVGA
jgi:Methylamine utilisation protein MauE